MFYVPTEYSNYKYLVQVSDNYIVLSNDNMINGTWDSPDEINVIYQYLTPSITTIKGTYSSTSTRRFTNISSQISDNIYVRADFPQLFMCNIAIVLIILVIFNGITRIVKRGGAIFGV